ncbi:type II toxin-antitoxin system VapC family toxin [Occallatibacter riparius]|uniref:Ribonuclease VapC n=1 Tax=Occallatibacter riparius TaxID=1002689 RepID=A0A9J7BMH7_9BACT|nr:PIN domain nuclease [Occallatibacter riparius]UWZ83883.1 PIN domain nuclease [Occallatibacter riparius]
MIIVDTSVWIEFLRGSLTAETRWLRNALVQNQELGLTSLILCEVLQGIPQERQFRETREYLSSLPVFEASDEETAVAAAENYRALRALSFTVRSTIDCMTATFCIREGYGLLHRDRDFAPFSKHLKLAVVDPVPTGS